MVKYSIEFNNSNILVSTLRISNRIGQNQDREDEGMPYNRAHQLLGRVHVVRAIWTNPKISL